MVVSHSTSGIPGSTRAKSPAAASASRGMAARTARWVIEIEPSVQVRRIASVSTSVSSAAASAASGFARRRKTPASAEASATWPSIQGTVERLSTTNAPAKRLGVISSPCPTAAKFSPPPQKAPAKVPPSFQVSGPSTPAKSRLATKAPTKVPKPAIPNPTTIRGPACRRSASRVESTNSTMA